MKIIPATDKSFAHIELTDEDYTQIETRAMLGLSAASSNIRGELFNTREIRIKILKFAIFTASQSDDFEKRSVNEKLLDISHIYIQFKQLLEEKA